jgi:hypothetical protein
MYPKEFRISARRVKNAYQLITESRNNRNGRGERIGSLKYVKTKTARHGSAKTNPIIEVEKCCRTKGL